MIKISLINIKCVRRITKSLNKTEQTNNSVAAAKCTQRRPIHNGKKKVLNRNDILLLIM